MMLHLCINLHLLLESLIWLGTQEGILRTGTAFLHSLSWGLERRVREVDDCKIDQLYRTSTSETILASPGTGATCTDDRRGKHDGGGKLMNLRLEKDRMEFVFVFDVQATGRQERRYSAMR